MADRVLFEIQRGAYLLDVVVVAVAPFAVGIVFGPRLPGKEGQLARSHQDSLKVAAMWYKRSVVLERFFVRLGE